MKLKKFTEVYWHLSDEAGMHQDSTGHRMNPNVTIVQDKGGTPYEYVIRCEDCDFTYAFHDTAKCRMCYAEKKGGQTIEDHHSH